MQEADHEKNNAAVDGREPLHDLDTGLRVVRVGDAVVVQLVGDERVDELAEPQLQQRGKHMRVINSFEAIVTLVDPKLQVGDEVAIARNAEDTLRFGTSESQDPICQER